MSMQRQRIKRGRSGRPHSELDWFAEDPWGDPDTLVDHSDDWELDFSVPSSNGAQDDWDFEDDDDAGSEDWGPVRRRRQRRLDR